MAVASIYSLAPLLILYSCRLNISRVKIFVVHGFEYIVINISRIMKTQHRITMQNKTFKVKIFQITL